MREMIPQIEPLFGEEEARALGAYMRSGGWLTEHAKTRELEEMIADYVGARHCVMVPNCTLALYAALVCLGIGPGDEVVVPALTMCATANAAVMANVTPVFVDVDEEDLCLDLGEAAEALTDRTRAIVVVSLNGRAPDMAAARAFAEDNGLWLVEDAAQALGSRQGGQCLGTFGDAGCYSFSPHKIVSTGQGGCVVTDDDAFADILRRFKNFGRARAGGHDHETFGVNLKFTDLQAVVGIEQVKKLDARVRRKREIYALYRHLLEGVEEVEFLDINLDDATPWRVDPLAADRAGLAAYLAECGVGTQPMYPSVPSLPPYGGRSGEFPVAERAAREGLWLPSALTLGDGDVEYVCDAVRTFYRVRRYDTL